MLSKFIYKFILVALLAVFTQVSYGQNYVGSKAAVQILTEEISQVQLEQNKSNPVSSSLVTDNHLSVENLAKVKLMISIKMLITDGSTVEESMNYWFDRIEAIPSENQSVIESSLNEIQNLLS